MAGEDIARGTRILRERPVLGVNAGVRDLKMRRVEEIFLELGEERVEMEKEKVELRTVVNSFIQLSEKDKTKYLDLKCEENVESDNAVIEAADNSEHCDLSFGLFAKICSIYTTNTFHNGICLEMSRFNHSCWPNAECFWNEETKTRDIVAVEDIAQGDEICHNYLQRCALHRDRQKTLMRKWKFQCSCRLCCLEEDESNRAEFIYVETLLFNKKVSVVGIYTSEAVLLATEVRGVRVLNIIKLVEAAFHKSSAARGLFLNREDRNILHNLAVEGLEYSELLFGRSHRSSQLWQERLASPDIYFVKQKFWQLFQALWFLATSALILYNFHHCECLQFLLLVGAVLINQKMV